MNETLIKIILDAILTINGELGTYGVERSLEMIKELETATKKDFKSIVASIDGYSVLEFSELVGL